MVRPNSHGSEVAAVRRLSGAQQCNNVRPLPPSQHERLLGKPTRRYNLFDTRLSF